MATTIGTETDLESLLSDLIELDYDATAAYEAAIERLDDDIAKQRLTEFKADHTRHIHELGQLMRDMGEAPPESGDMKSVLTQGKVVMAGLSGDKAILKAMRSNESDTNSAYERASGRDDLTPEIQAVLDKNLGDERRHRDWIEEYLAALE